LLRGSSSETFLRLWTRAPRMTMGGFGGRPPGRVGRGFIGPAIVARGFIGPPSPLGTMVEVMAGVTLAFRMRGEERVGITFYGDGATSTGAWHEGISFAGIHQLPVVFVCENNSWAISTHISKEVPVTDIAIKAAGYNMPGCTVDGNDLFAVYEAASAAMHRARSGGGPRRAARSRVVRVLGRPSARCVAVRARRRSERRGANRQHVHPRLRQLRRAVFQRRRR